MKLGIVVSPLLLLFGAVGCNNSVSPGGGRAGSSTANAGAFTNPFAAPEYVPHDGGASTGIGQRDSGGNPPRVDGGGPADDDSGVNTPRDGGGDPPRDGGGGGELLVSRDRFLDDLDAEEIRNVCEWTAAQQGGPGMYECGDGITITVDTVDDCIADGPRPHCMVGLLADCISALGGDPCAIFSTEACGPFFQCASGE